MINGKLINYCTTYPFYVFVGSGKKNKMKVEPS